MSIKKSLTKEEELILTQTREEWANLFFDIVKEQKEIDRSAFEEGIKWLYEDLLKKPNPKVIYCDSWLSCLLTMVIFKEYNLTEFTGVPIGSSIGTSLWYWMLDDSEDLIASSFKKSVLSTIRSTTNSTILDSIESSVRNSVLHSIESSVNNPVKNTVWDTAQDSIGNSISNLIGVPIRDSLIRSVSASVQDVIGDFVIDFNASSAKDLVSESVLDHIGISSFWDSVWVSVGSPITNATLHLILNLDNDYVKKSIREVFNWYSSYFDLSNYGWISFYDFLEKIGILNNDDFKKYKKIIKSGVFNVYEYENVVFAIQPPTYVNRDNLGNLHSIEGSAFRFRDGSEYFYIHGVNIKENVYTKLINNEYTFEDFTKENDEEVKSAILSFIEEKYGSEALFRFISSNLTEVDSFVDKKQDLFLEGTTKGMNIGVYTLFKGKLDDIDLAFVRCFCPSTDRMFFLCVDPSNENAKDAIASLYRIPRKVASEIKYIQRQGERFSTVLTDKGKEIFKTLSKKDISDLIHISGEEYFSKMRYEY